MAETEPGDGPLITSVSEYIIDKCATYGLAAGGGNCMIMMLKGVTPADLEQVMASHVVDPHLSAEDLHKFIMKLGREIPMVLIQDETLAMFHYKTRVMVDLADPRSVGQIDRLIEHITRHDSLAEFQL
jgi:hypothetical protein